METIAYIPYAVLKSNCKSLYVGCSSSYLTSESAEKTTTIKVMRCISTETCLLSRSTESRSMTLSVKTTDLRSQELLLIRIPNESFTIIIQKQIVAVVCWLLCKNSTLFSEPRLQILDFSSIIMKRCHRVRKICKAFLNIVSIQMLFTDASILLIIDMSQIRQLEKVVVEFGGYNRAL